MVTYKKLVDIWSISAGARRTFKLRDLDKRIDGRIAYLQRVTLRSILTVSFTAQPGVVGHNNLFKKITFAPFGGSQVRASLSGNALRMFERLENGKAKVGEAIQTTTGSPRHFSRVIEMGPANAANPEEFAICCAGMVDGTLEVEFGALTDISADTTAMSGTVQVIAEYIVRDNELVVGPTYERREDFVAMGEILTGEQLLMTLGLVNSSSYDALAAGDIANVTLETGRFNPINSVPAEALTACFNHDFAPGEIGAIQGEPEDATDVHQRQVNLASPTAIAAQTADLQPIWWSGKDSYITKAGVYCPNQFKLLWSGSQTSTGTGRLTGRALPLEASEVQRVVDTACRELGIVTGAPTVKTLSKEPFKGPAWLRRFMPHYAKAGRA